ncbi:hypothetical protein [Mesorhizobium sp. ES1-1]|uniref:hypothetical protein n=1 Tax=Mesorhizobium sp. ES1-1 TaxID=2876629 RepID=UPI001CC93101|nr:hypothetical protein [Mesorhizobium sp. ES1-1]MBZ9678902.1 hypothetical protein [Mesorhizobium sp. ES1-1]
MAALTQARNTPKRDGRTREFGVKGATKIWQGSMVALDSSGRAVPFSVSTTLKGVGRAELTADNSAGADNAIRAKVLSDTFRFNNSAAGDLITTADIGSDCYGVDDQTVAKTNGTNTRSVAGKIYDVDALGVWVKFTA